MVNRVEMDSAVSIADQMRTEVGPVVLVNRFSVAEAEADALLAAWQIDAGFFRSQPGYISTQLHRGINGSSLFLNCAVWESVEALRRATQSPGFAEASRAYPPSTVSSPHLFRKLAMPGFCVA